MTRLSPFPPLLIAAALAGCGLGAEPDSGALGPEAANIDPAVTSALEDPILVDPALAQQAHALSVRPPESPFQAQYPLGADPSDPPAAAGPCGAAFAHGSEWAGRMPPEFPLYPGARLVEAAGVDAGDCVARFIAFRTDREWPQVLAWYRGTATRGGFSFAHQARGDDQIAAGARARTGETYLIVATPRPGGSEVALIVSSGG